MAWDEDTVIAVWAKGALSLIMTRTYGVKMFSVIGSAGATMGIETHLTGGKSITLSQSAEAGPTPSSTLDRFSGRPMPVGRMPDDTEPILC